MIEEQVLAGVVVRQIATQKEFLVTTGTSTKIFPKIVCWSLFFSATSCSLRAQGDSPQDIQETCQNFVQGFYNWYVPKALRDNTRPAWELALKYKRYPFSLERRI